MSAAALADELDLENWPVRTDHPQVPCSGVAPVWQCPNQALWQAVLTPANDCVGVAACVPCREDWDRQYAAAIWKLYCPVHRTVSRFVRWEPIR